MTPTALTAEYLAAQPLPQLDGAAEKNARGRVLVFAGGAQLPGAALLVGLAALRAGAGRVQLVATAEARSSLGAAFPEARILTGPHNGAGEICAAAAGVLAEAIASADALVVGPGMVDEAEAGELASAIIQQEPRRLVVDAGAFSCFREAIVCGLIPSERVVLTPHAGELSKLMGLTRAHIEQDRLAHAQAAADRFGATVVLKGPQTVIASPGSSAIRHFGNEPGLGTAGSGDVLAGVIGGLFARGADARTAAAWAVYAHARAGAELAKKVAPTGFLARELIAEIPGAFAALEAGRS